MSGSKSRANGVTVRSGLDLDERRRVPRWTRLPLCLLTIVAFVLSATPAEAAPHSIVFTHGVASGDVTSTSAVLWTRVDHGGKISVEVSTDPSFMSHPVAARTLAAGKDDFTAKIFVTGLTPDQQYFYRWRAHGVTSEVGSFRTAPLPSVPKDLRFAYSGDSDGTKVLGVPFFNEFETLEAARLEGLDFFVYLGDTIYSDSLLRPFPATTLGEYQDAYRVNRGYARLRDLLGATSTYAIWDDHEVRNDFAGATVDPSRFANGREAFLDYLPLDGLSLVDPACAGDPLFRVFHWGSAVDLIIPDERSCRSAEATAACTYPTGVLDPVPTLPPDQRTALGLPPSPPPGCLDAINDPSRTMLGSVQKAAFLSALEESSATFKIVVNEVAIQQFWALPYDRWEGYGAERREILSFIRDEGIRNVLFLTTDNHAVLMNEVFVDRFTDPEPIAYEAVTGPIATFTLQQEALALGGPAALTALNRLLTIAGVDCRNLDVFSYGLVDVDASGGTARITMKDSTGSVVHDQRDTGIACEKTFGGPSPFL